MKKPHRMIAVYLTIVIGASSLSLKFAIPYYNIKAYHYNILNCDTGRIYNTYFAKLSVHVSFCIWRLCFNPLAVIQLRKRIFLSLHLASSQFHIFLFWTLRALNLQIYKAYNGRDFILIFFSASCWA